MAMLRDRVSEHPVHCASGQAGADRDTAGEQPKLGRKAPFPRRYARFEYIILRPIAVFYGRRRLAVNSERQPTLTIIGSMAGSILVSTIAIATLIVLQHGAMRSDMGDQHAAMRSDMNNQFTTLRGDMSEQLTTLRGDMSDQFTTLRGDIREIRGDVGELRERMARIEVFVERGAANRPEPAAQ